VAHVRACYGQAGGVVTAETPHETFMKAEQYFDAGDNLATRPLGEHSRPTRSRDNLGTSPDWELVGNLRREVAKYLPGQHGDAKIGYFAVTEQGVVKFFRVKQVTKGRWAGKVFVDIQASDDMHPIRTSQRLASVLSKISEDPVGAAKLYASELGNCYACNRTLTDPESIALGIGPVCRNK
jgi:hypothetical protein